MRPKPPPPDPYARDNFVLRVVMLLVILIGLLFSIALSASTNTVADSDSRQPPSFTILVVILVLPDGTYKEYVKEYGDMKECDESLPEWIEQINDKMDSRITYAITCQQTRMVEAKKF